MSVVSGGSRSWWPCWEGCRICASVGEGRRVGVGVAGLRNWCPCWGLQRAKIVSRGRQGRDEKHRHYSTSVEGREAARLRLRCGNEGGSRDPGPTQWKKPEYGSGAGAVMRRGVRRVNMRPAARWGSGLRPDMLPRMEKRRKEEPGSQGGGCRCSNRRVEETTGEASGWHAQRRPCEHASRCEDGSRGG